VDAAPATTALPEKTGAAPLFRTRADEVEVLAVSVMSEGLEPSIKELPHSALKLLEVPLGIRPGKFWLIRLNDSLVQSEQVASFGRVALPAM